MGANEKYEAAMHGYVPTEDQLRGEFHGLEAEFDRAIEKIKAEAKAEALEEAASKIDRLDSDVEMYDENLNARQVSHWLRDRANQYKEAPSA